MTCFNVIHYKSILEVVLYTYISFSVSTIQQFLKQFSEVLISVDVCAWTNTWTPSLGISVYNFLQSIRLFLTLQQMYGVDVKEGGGGEGGCKKKFLIFRRTLIDTSMLSLINI